MAALDRGTTLFHGRNCCAAQWRIAVASGELDDLPLPANSGVPDLIIWDSIRDCATAELAKLVSTIESEIASDKTLADLQKTGWPFQIDREICISPSL
jgi:hypothetical protein